MKKNFFLRPAALIFPLLLAACGPRDEVPRIPEKLLDAYAAAKADYLAGSFDKAEGAFRRLTTERGDFFQARLMLGKTLFSRGKTAGAEEVFRALLERFPACREAELWSARCETANGRADAARTRLERLLAFDSSDPRLLSLYARACAAGGDAARALQYYRLGSQYEEELALNRFESARYYYQFGMYERALGEIDKCLALLADGSALRASVLELKKNVSQKTGGKK